MAVSNLVITQGKTFQRIIRWESPPFIYVPISAITKTAPAVITTTAPHSIPDGWRVAVVSVQGMTEINAANTPPKDKDYTKATITGPSEVTLNEVNAAEYSTYTSGGYIQYYTPVDLAAYDARMQIKDKVGGTELELLEAPADITIDNSSKAITLTITAAATEAYTWKKGVYDLEMFNNSGDVIGLLSGTVTVVREVTTAP